MEDFLYKNQLSDCPNCGFELSELDKDCPACGINLVGYNKDYNNNWNKIILDTKIENLKKAKLSIKQVKEVVDKEIESDDNFRRTKKGKIIEEIKFCLIFIPAFFICLCLFLFVWKLLSF